MTESNTLLLRRLVSWRAVKPAFINAFNEPTTIVVITTRL